MKPVFKIGTHDWTWILNEESMSWSVNDLDSQKTGRSYLSGQMSRSRIARKRKLVFRDLKRLNFSDFHNLLADLSPEMFSVTILDPLHGGVRTSQFYDSAVEAANQVYDSTEDTVYYDGIVFTMTEK